MDIISQIRKTLSANDVGATGAHQAGILIPKNPKILAFFPSLDKSVKESEELPFFLRRGRHHKVAVRIHLLQRQALWRNPK